MILEKNQLKGYSNDESFCVQKKLNKKLELKKNEKELL